MSPASIDRSTSLTLPIERQRLIQPFCAHSETCGSQIPSLLPLISSRLQFRLLRPPPLAEFTNLISQSRQTLTREVCLLIGHTVTQVTGTTRTPARTVGNACLFPTVKLIEVQPRPKSYVRLPETTQYRFH